MDAARPAARPARQGRHQGADRTELGGRPQRSVGPELDRSLCAPGTPQARAFGAVDPHRARPGLPARGADTAAIIVNLHIARQSLLGALHPFTRIRSLHRQLLLWLLLPQLVLWLAAAAVSYATAARYANKAIDASLSQAARSLARQVKPIGNGLFIDFPRAAQDIIEADRDEGVFYMVSTPPGKYILGNRKLDDPPLPKDPPLGTPHLYNSTVEKMPVRVAALYLAYGDDAANKQTLLVQ